MTLPSDLVSQFARITNDKSKDKKESTSYGTIVERDGRKFVKMDGSDLLTPVTTTTSIYNGERVTVQIKNHQATVTGNITSPSARLNDITDVSEKIVVMDGLIANKVDTGDFNAEVARIDQLTADNVVIKQSITASEGDISKLETNNLLVNEKLTANEAAITKLQSEKIDTITANATYATITNLDATNANVRNLDAAYADINTLIFGSASGTTIHTSFSNAVIAQLGNAQIKSAMIDSVSANQIKAGDIITNNVRVKSEDGSLIISDETMQISDDTRVRVQIGKDASNDYSINIWDAEGNLMFSKGGITDSAIKEAIIRNDMVSDTANIAAHKLDIDSLFEEINGSTNTIKSTKIYLDDEEQTLDVAFDSLSTEVSELGETITSQGTDISVIQGKISSKVWQQDINTAKNEMSTQYSTLSQTVNGISSTVAEHTTAFDNLEIGGRNLLLNSDFVKDSSKWTYNSVNPFEYVADEGYSGGGAIRATVTTGSTVVPRQAMSKTFASGTSLTCSVKIKEEEGEWGTASQGRFANLYSIPYAYHKDLGDGWTLYVYTSTLTEDVVVGTANVFGFSNIGVGVFIIDQIKLEIGTKATDWTPAPEDIDSDINSLVNRMTTAETTISSNAQAISLTATKTEVATAKSEAISSANTNTTNKLKDYSTTEQMNAAIKLSADNITTTVSSTYATKTAVNDAQTAAQNAQNAIDNLEIGGRNLILNSSFDDGLSKWSVSSNTISIVEGFNGNGLQMVITANGTVTPRQGLNMTLKTGETLTGSVKTKTVSGNFSTFQIRFAGLVSMELIETRPIDEEWSLYIYQFTATSDLTFTSSNVFGFAYGDNGTYIIDDIKLEKGNKATDWTPAPEDISSDISSLGTRMSTVEQTAEGLTVSVADSAKTATNFLKYSSSGLVVGDITASTLGKNVLIDSDSVDIRNGTTTLASFGSNTVTLGRNAEDSVIDLCNGAGKISANTASAATSYPNRNAILIDSQEIETESVRFVASTSNGYGSSSTPSIKRGTELYMLRSTSSTTESCARLKAEHKTTSSGAYTNAGISAMTYDSADKTRAMVYASDSANSNNNQVNVYPTKTTMNKNLVLNGTTFTGKNKVLWSGGYYMNDTQTATLSEAISAQANGVVLVWSEYTDGESVNANFNMFFVPKHFITLHAGKGMANFIGNGSGNIMCMKYVYISDTSIKGYAANNSAATEKNCGITMTANKFVLRYVIGV